MSDMTADRMEIELGRLASRELALTDLAFSKTRQKLVDELFNTAPGHSERREQIYYQVQALEAARTMLTGAVGAGEAAKLRLTLAEDPDQ